MYGNFIERYDIVTNLAKGNISTSVDPNKENMIRFERHKTEDLGPGNRRARRFLERSVFARVLLGCMAMFGVSLIISDGILTPAQSVLGAIQGMKRSQSILSLSSVLSTKG